VVEFLRVFGHVGFFVLCDASLSDAHTTNGRIGMKSVQGHFLVASPHQRHPTFVESVVLVVEDSDWGAFGVILNCPRERIKTSPQKQRSERPLSGTTRTYFGGPITGPLMAVHADQSFAEHEIMPGVFFAGKEENVVHLMRQTTHSCKVFTGYTGWGPGQIKYEIERGVWRAVPAAADLVFSRSNKLWTQLARKALEMQLKMLFNVQYISADPQLN